MRAGLLRDKITIQKPTTSKNEYGSTEITWADVYNTRAQVAYQNGYKKTGANEIYNIDKIYFTIRSNMTIENTYRILFKDKKFKIDFVKINPYPAASQQIETEVINE
jgi:SPP1 family predicted phage head-tail adaptor